MATVIGTFASQDDAEQAIEALKDEGYDEQEISLVARNEENGGNGTMNMGQNIAGGTATGGALGGLAGILAGIGALAIPGIGPIVAAGPIAAGLSGAVVGGITGGLVDMGIPEERGQYYEDRVREGDLLVALAAPEEEVDRAAQVLRDYGADDVESH